MTAKYDVPDDHWEEDDEDDNDGYDDDRTSIQSHEVDVVLTTDPTEDMGYGRERYTVHISHTNDDAPYALYATKHRWKGNYWRDYKRIDWQDVPKRVRDRTADVVACDGPQDLHPGHRLIGEGGEKTWDVRRETEAPVGQCEVCGGDVYRDDDPDLDDDEPLKHTACVIYDD